MEIIASTNQIVTIQQTFSPALPLIFGCKEYQEEVELLDRINRVLEKSGLEKHFVEKSLIKYEERMKEEGKEVTPWMKSYHAVLSQRVLRYNILRSLLGESFRGMSKRLAECCLFQHFCKLAELGGVRIPSKSSLQSYEHWLSAEEIKELLNKLTMALADEKQAEEMGLEEVIKMEVFYTDTTCLEANIHFPIDWILMRDAVRSLMKRIITIGRHGLRKRMPEPMSFIKEINKLCIAMSSVRRQEGSNKKRKAIFRLMKKLLRKVEQHAKGYRRALDEEWQQTDLSRKQTQFILRGLDHIIAQLPQAMKQAHERIIGARQVASKEKILSLHEKDIHVILRGKAGAEVEFGNTLFIVEDASGYIVTHELLKESSPGDANLLLKHCEEIQQITGQKIKAVGGDRQFSTKATKQLLKEKNIFNALCPKDVAELSDRLTEKEFKRMLRRRAQTEGRVGIVKNVFLQEIPKAKGFEHRAIQVSWAILAHNLWLIARKALWKEVELAPLTVPLAA